MANYLGASVFVAFDGDHIGREVGRASLANDVEGLRKLSQAIEAGNNLWGSWALAAGGTVISLGGDEGRLEVPADKLADLPGLQAQYQSAVGAPCSVGVGLELSEADKALLYAKVHGGNRVCFFTPDVNDEVQELADRQERRSEVDKIADEYLGKSLMTYEDIEGFRKAGEAPGKAQPPHENQSASGSQGQQAAATVQGAQAQQMDAPPAPPPAGETELEQRLHAHAKKQKGQDAATLAVQQQQGNKEALRQQVVKVLKQVKAAAPLLEEAKGQAPQVYKAVMGAIQAMVAMAKQLAPSPDGDAQSPGGDSPVQDNAPGGEKSPDGDDLGKAEADRHKCVKCGSRNIAFAEPRTGARLRPSPNSKLGGIGHCTDCGSNQIRRLKYHGPRKGHDAEVIAPKQEQEEARKAELPMPDAGPTHRELNLPVGSERDGRVKVRHGDGTASWVEVRSGMVMSQDGHPISARNPGGK